MSAELEVRGAEQLADWVEATLVARGTRQIGADELFRLARSEADASIAQTSLARRVMARRHELLGSRYPFYVSDLAVRALPTAPTAPYVALLHLSSGSAARQLVRRESSSEMEVLFERVCEAALKHLWGEGGEALRFGWPSDSGRPPEFHMAIEWLAGRMGLEAGRGYRPPRRKDGGVDVVAWRPFPDGRSGFPMVLAQCTLQAELISKSADVDSRVWASWLVLDFDPITALAVPQTIGAGELWNQLALRCMVLDRVRLTGLIPHDFEVQGLSPWVSETNEMLAKHLEGAQT